MTWFLRRSQALARQGWIDNFNRANESPVKQPWSPWGESVVTNLESNRLTIGDSDWFKTGGVGFEHQPLTPNWGIEFNCAHSIYTKGSDAQETNLGEIGIKLNISYNWTRGSAMPPDVPVVAMYWVRTRQSNGSTTSRHIALFEKDTTAFIDFGSNRADASLTQTEWAQPHNWKVWCYNDRTYIVWMDGVVRMIGTIMDSNCFTAPGRRAVNFQKAGTQDTWLENFALYDRLGVTAGMMPWSSLFYDDFNRTNGAVGNGWTVLGSAGQISSNAYASTGGTDGGKAIIRDTGLTGGKMRIEATVKSPSGHESAIILHSNSTGTQGLAARVTSSNIKLFRFSTVLTGNPPTWTALGVWNAPSSSIATGETLAFETRGDGTAFVWRGDELLAYAEDVFANVTQTNSWAGEFVSRSLFVNSGQWDDCRILQAA